MCIYECVWKCEYVEKVCMSVQECVRQYICECAAKVCESVCM